MDVDSFSRITLNEDDLVDLFMKDKDVSFKYALVEDQINNELDIDFPKLVKVTESDETIEDFDEKQQQKWFIPEAYTDIDIAKWVLDQCDTEEEITRAGDELVMFADREMMPLLRYMKYFVDVAAKHNIVLGVGRGSSIASFVLYKIGVHKINPIKYNIPITEFLKENI